jgi:hypothetical protein
MPNQTNLHNKVWYIVLDAIPLLYREGVPSKFNNSLQPLHHKEQKYTTIILEDNIINIATDLRVSIKFVKNCSSTQLLPYLKLGDATTV